MDAQEMEDIFDNGTEFDEVFDYDPFQEEQNEEPFNTRLMRLVVPILFVLKLMMFIRPFKLLLMTLLILLVFILLLVQMQALFIPFNAFQCMAGKSNTQGRITASMLTTRPPFSPTGYTGPRSSRCAASAGPQ